MAVTPLKRGQQRMHQGLLGLLRRFTSSEALSLIISAVCIGVLTGLAAVAFDRMVHYMGAFVHTMRVSLGQELGSLIVVLIPALGGLLIAPIVVKWSPDVRGSGIPGVMLAVSNFSGRVAKRIILWRPIATTLSVGTGASLGTEGPVVQLGASIASAVSDVLRLNDVKRKNLVAVAVSGGVAATFNAPIAGVLFTLEVILGQFSNRYFASVVIGAVSASAVSQYFLGSDPAFTVPDYTFGSALELPFYLLLGVVCALAGVLFIRVVVAGENLFDRLRMAPWLRPVFGGLLVGTLGLFLPDLLGRGFNATGLALQGDTLALPLLIALAFGKMLTTSISLASWGSGGVFAPTLMIGATLGDAFGQFTAQIFPNLGLSPGAFALVGMAGLFSGVTRAPMSTIMMIFELSGSYQLILPLLLTAVVATLLADSMHPESIYQIILSRRGLSLLRLRESDLLQTVTVQEVMSEKVPKLHPDDTLKDLEEALSYTHNHGFVLTPRSDPDHIVGIVTLGDLERAKQRGTEASTKLHAIAVRTVQCALPHETVSEVLERMGDLSIGRMPVVSPEDQRRVIGFVRQSDLVKAYYAALQRQRQSENANRVKRLRDLTGQEIVEVRVRRESPVLGKALREISFPKQSIVVTIRRRDRTVFPNGDTRLEFDDVVVANVAIGYAGEFRKLFSGANSRLTLF